MPKGLNALLGPDLLVALRSMGHGDELVLVGPQPPRRRVAPAVIRFDGISATRALNAVLPVMPLDNFVPR